jgi:3-isopropylmalate dehydrogenase
MLEWLGERHNLPACVEAARLLTHAVDAAFAVGDLVGYENGGTAGTDEISARVRAHLWQDGVMPAGPPKSHSAAEP